MRFKKICALMICTAAVAAVFSCKKDEETTYKSFEGTLEILGSRSIIEAGETLTFTPKGLTLPEDTECYYKWTVTGDIADTSRFDDGHYVYTFPSDTCMTYTVTCSVSASGYYSSSTYAYVTTIKTGPDGSIPEIYRTFTLGSVQDSDGIKYGYVKIGEDYWTMMNLGTSGSGLGYRGYDVTSELFGRYYNYEEAMEICPEGWHLPSEKEWMDAAQTVAEETLELYETWPEVSGAMMVDASFNARTLWEYWPDVKITNATGLCALPLGYANLEAESFTAFYDFAAFWTADKFNENQAYVRYIFVDKPDMYCFPADIKSFGASVRCVKDR